MAHRAPDRAAGPTGRTNARAVDERASSIVAVGAPVIMIRFVSGEVQVKPRVFSGGGTRRDDVRGCGAPPNILDFGSSQAPGGYFADRERTRGEGEGR